VLRLEVVNSVTVWSLETCVLVGPLLENIIISGIAFLRLGLNPEPLSAWLSGKQAYN
jgi:hypothetical protein